MANFQRIQGGLICLGALGAAAFFLYGLLRGSYLALAVPVAAAVFFVLGLTFWVGWTILQIQVEAEVDLADPVQSDADPPAADS